METMELKLNSPITKEQWELLTDANLEHSDTMWFDTPNGNHFEYKKVRNGKWVKNEDSVGWNCSCCGVVDVYAYSWDSETGKYAFQDRFCPNCGARMDGE